MAQSGQQRGKFRKGLRVLVSSVTIGMNESPNKLIAIGYWKSTSSSLCRTPGLLPNPALLVKPKRNFEESLDHVLGYLANGSELLHWRGFSHCRICEVSDQTMGSRCLTDGTWVWPEGLAHYVATHSIDLPDELVHLMRENSWVPHQSEIVVPRDVSSVYDFSFWIDWAASGVS